MTSLIAGGAWLLPDRARGTIFTREMLTEEQRLIAAAADEFMRQEVLPSLDALERKDWERATALLRRAGELGLLGVDAPESLGGVGLDKVSSILVGEAVGLSASFATAFGAQAGLALTPLLTFGTSEQQQRYVPRLVSGELVGAYALSESGAGSDALGARTRATRDADGRYLLNGEKMWITNGGFADLFIVFAKVDGEAFTAFLVERGFPGVSTGKEEHKMGLHGSSTTPLILQDARVPAANVLGEIGRGHKIAFTVLNYGRLKLAAMCLGGARLVIAEAVRYARQRRQFGTPIAEFGAIRHKLAEMTVRAYAVDAMLYRAAGQLDAALADASAPPLATLLEELAIEASILKVAGSEMLDFVADENVQIHGGNGFVRDYAAERYYRDARINRIFEGTNEINRLLIPGMLARRALKGDLPLLDAARRLEEEILSPPAPSPSSDGPLDAEDAVVAGLRRTALMVLGTAMRTYRDTLTDQQEVLTLAGDIVIDVYAADSCVARARRARELGASPDLHDAAARIVVHDAALRVDAAARTALAAMAQGDTLRTLLAGLRRFLKPPATDTIGLRRIIAEAVVGGGWG